MAAGFEFFKYDDAGAPVLNGAAGRLIALLDWILVTKGGWVKEYTGTNLAAYRSGTGNRFYMRVDDTQVAYSRVRAYRTMTAVSTGTNPFPTNAQMGNVNTWGIRKAYDAGTTAEPQKYWGVRTNKYFILVVENISDTDFPSVAQRYRNWLVFGDVPSLCEADSHNTIIAAQKGVDTYYVEFFNYSLESVSLTPNYVYNAAAMGAGVSGTPNGAVVSPLCGIHWPYGSGATDAQKAALALSDRLYFGPLVVGSSNSPTVNNGTFPRARVPNVQALYGVGNDIVDPQLPVVDMVPFTIGSRSFLPIVRYVNGTGGLPGETLLLETTDTDGAL